MDGTTFAERKEIVCVIPECGQKYCCCKCQRTKKAKGSGRDTSEQAVHLPQSPIVPEWKPGVEREGEEGKHLFVSLESHFLFPFKRHTFFNSFLTASSGAACINMCTS